MDFDFYRCPQCGETFEGLTVVDETFSDRVAEHKAMHESPLMIIDAYNTVQLPVVLEAAFGVTRSQARRDLRGGGVRIDGEKYYDLTCARMDLDGKVLQLGKRRFARIEFA